MRILLNQTIPFCHVNGLSNTGKTLHQTLVFDANTSSNTSVSSTLIKQSSSSTTPLDWFIAIHLRSHFKNSFWVFDQRYQSTRTPFWNNTNKTFISFMELKQFIYEILFSCVKLPMKFLWGMASLFFNKWCLEFLPCQVEWFK